MLNYLYIILLSLLPSVCWILIVARFIDRKNPESFKDLIKVFLFGCLIVVPAFLLIEGARYFLFQLKISEIFRLFALSFLIDGLIEESAKFFVLKDFVFKNKFFDEPLDGLVYGATAAMGFAFIENIMYLIFSRPELIILRFITPTLMHALATGIVGYHLALAKFKNVSLIKKRFYICSGILLAVLFHGLFNSVIRYNFFFNYIPLAILIVASYIYLLRGLKKFRREKDLIIS